jgi:hypothetical protein
MEWMLLNEIAFLEFEEECEAKAEELLKALKVKAWRKGS